MNQYDDNYLYFLIEDYLKEFRDKRIVQEMKDSPLYILIAEKIEEIDKKKDSFQEKLEEKKEKYQEREENFDKLKEKYYDLSRMNKELLELQYEQDKTLKDLRKKNIPDDCIGCEHDSYCRGGLKCLTYALFNDLNHKDVGCDL